MSKCGHKLLRDVGRRDHLKVVQLRLMRSEMGCRDGGLRKGGMGRMVEG